MENQDTRCFPQIEIELNQIQALLSPILKGTEITSAKCVEGGLVNTLYRIWLANGSESLGLRIFATGQPAWEKERQVLTKVGGAIPVPEILMAGHGEARFPHPYLVYRWIEGLTLNECRKQRPQAAFLSLAKPLGRMLADLANFSFTDASDEELKSLRAGLLSLETVLSINEERLRRGAVRTRLGARLADVLRCRLNENSARLTALDYPISLAHGDFSGRNILVAPADENNWRIAGLIDWETAFFGSALWDLGSLFRYAKRYSETFRRSFEQSYHEAGGTLPRDWWRIARLLDATKLIAILNEDRELPIVFAECRELIEAVVAGGE